jgi:hypothetical protein
MLSLPVIAPAFPNQSLSNFFFPTQLCAVPVLVLRTKNAKNIVLPGTRTSTGSTSTSTCTDFGAAFGTHTTGSTFTSITEFFERYT